jgi:hypothetical protein
MPRVSYRCIGPTKLGSSSPFQGETPSGASLCTTQKPASGRRSPLDEECMRMLVMGSTKATDAHRF